MVRVTVARDRFCEVRVGGREEGGDSGRSIPFSTSEARLAKNLLRSNPIVFEGVVEHRNVGIGTLVFELVVLRRFGRRSARRSTWSTERDRATGSVAIFVFAPAKQACKQYLRGGRVRAHVQPSTIAL